MQLSGQVFLPPIHADVTDAIQKKAHSFADKMNNDSRRRRAEKARRLDKRGVERDRIGEIFGAVDHFDNERLPAGKIERVN